MKKLIKISIALLCMTVFVGCIGDHGPSLCIYDNATNYNLMLVFYREDLLKDSISIKRYSLYQANSYYEWAEANDSVDLYKDEVFFKRYRDDDYSRREKTLYNWNYYVRTNLGRSTTAVYTYTFLSEDFE